MEQDLTRGSVLKNVVRFSLPYLLSYFLQTLYGMADLFIVGQYARLLAYTKAHGLVAGFSREITLVDYGLTSDPEKFVTEITIPVLLAE